MAIDKKEPLRRIQLGLRSRNEIWPLDSRSEIRKHTDVVATAEQMGIHEQSASRIKRV